MMDEARVVYKPSIGGLLSVEGRARKQAIASYRLFVLFAEDARRGVLPFFLCSSVMMTCTHGMYGVKSTEGLEKNSDLIVCKDCFSHLCIKSCIGRFNLQGVSFSCFVWYIGF